MAKQHAALMSGFTEDDLADEGDETGGGDDEAAASSAAAPTVSSPCSSTLWLL